MKKSIIIVGGGIAGLSAGCYAGMNGFNTSIFEMNDIPGGLCAAWERKGYKWDISMHMLTGSVSGPFNKMWKELGVTEKFKFFFHKETSRIEGLEKSLIFSLDRKKLEEDLTALSPEDADLIREFTKLIFGPDFMNAASLNPKSLRKTGDSFKALFAVFPLLRSIRKYKRETIQQFTAKFKDPFVREMVRFFIDAPGWPMKDFPMIALAGFMKNGVMEAGRPLGGSQQVIYHIAELFTSLGGTIRYKSRVTNLIIEDNRVTGIELKDGSRFTADQVIWAGDGHTLIYKILEGKYINDTIRNMYEHWTPVKPVLHVMLGVNRDLSEEPHRLIFETDEPVTIAGEEHKWLTMIHHSFDPSMAPEGKSAMEVWYDTPYEYWEELAKNRPAYNAEKKRIAEYTVRQLDRRWPGFAGQVEVIDVPTPVTYTRYTGNWKGSPDGWYITADNMRTQEPLRSLPGLEGLKMIGQWTAPFTGTVIAALSGRQIIQLMCKEEGKKFVSTVQKDHH